jgi:hypothetical protein
VGGARRERNNSTAKDTNISEAHEKSASMRNPTSETDEKGKEISSMAFTVSLLVVVRDEGRKMSPQRKRQSQSKRS